MYTLFPKWKKTFCPSHRKHAHSAFRNHTTTVASQKTDHEVMPCRHPVPTLICSHPTFSSFLMHPVALSRLEGPAGRWGP